MCLWCCFRDEGFVLSPCLPFSKPLNRRFSGDQLIRLRGYSEAFHKDCRHRRVEIMNSFSWEQMILPWDQKHSEFGSPQHFFFLFMKMLETLSLMWTASVQEAAVCVPVWLAWKLLLMCKTYMKPETSRNPLPAAARFGLLCAFKDRFQMTQTPTITVCSHVRKGTAGCNWDSRHVPAHSFYVRNM